MTQTTTSAASPSSKAPRRPLNWRLVAGVAVLLLVVVGSAAAFFLTQQRQDVRQQAFVAEPGSGGGSTTPGCNSGFTCRYGFSDCGEGFTSIGGGSCGGGICCKPGSPQTGCVSDVGYLNPGQVKVGGCGTGGCASIQIPEYTCNGNTISKKCIGELSCHPSQSQCPDGWLSSPPTCPSHQDLKTIQKDGGGSCYQCQNKAKKTILPGQTCDAQQGCTCNIASTPSTPSGSIEVDYLKKCVSPTTNVSCYTTENNCKTAVNVSTATAGSDCSKTGYFSTQKACLDMSASCYTFENACTSIVIDQGETDCNPGRSKYASKDECLSKFCAKYSNNQTECLRSGSCSFANNVCSPASSSGTGGTTPTGSVCCKLVTGRYDFAPSVTDCTKLAGGTVINDTTLCEQDYATDEIKCADIEAAKQGKSDLSNLEKISSVLGPIRTACRDTGGTYSYDTCKCDKQLSCINQFGGLTGYGNAKSACVQEKGVWDETYCKCNSACSDLTSKCYTEGTTPNICSDKGMPFTGMCGNGVSGVCCRPSSSGSGTSSGTGGSTPSTGACAGVLQKCDNQSCCGGQNLVCTGVQGSRVCNQTGGNLCPGSNQCGGAGGYIGFRCGSATGGASGTECLENPQTFDTWEAAYNYAISGSQQGLPNNCGQVDEVCVGGSNNRNLCGSFVIVNSGCSGGGGGQSPAPSSTPVGPQCKRIEMQDNTSSQTITQPKSGQTVKFLCGLPQDAEDSRIHHFVFRVIEPDGNIVNLNAVSQKARQSVPYTVSGKTGQYFAQCQICTSANTCLPYEAYKQTSNTSTTGSMSNTAATTSNQLTGTTNTGSREDAANAAASDFNSANSAAAAQDSVKPVPAGPLPAQDDLGTTPGRTTPTNTGPFASIYNSVSSLWGGSK